MNRGLFFEFIKDMSGITFLVFLNTSFIIMFFCLLYGLRIEIIYPLVLALFLYIIFMTIKWIRYYGFIRKIERLRDNPWGEVYSSKCQEKRVIDIIASIHQNYTKKIENINLDTENKKYFLSQWIHNMKTPVSVMDLITQNMTSNNTIQGKDVNVIREENAKLYNQLDTVLTILRLEDFSRDFVPETIDLLSQIRKVINNRKNQFVYNHIFPKIQCGMEKVIVLTDGKWNEVMIDQILSNAVKYSKSNKEDKYIYFDFETDGTYTTLAIRDEGIGIPAHDIERIFEPFFTGENGRLNKNSSGIGLYLCSVIAERLNHKLSIESTHGSGTTVRITYLSKL